MKETLEEAAESCVKNEPDELLKLIIKYSFKEGAKWQQERMYSEEDMLKCWNAAYTLSIDEETYKPLFFADFIKQIKKK